MLKKPKATKHMFRYKFLIVSCSVCLLPPLLSGCGTSSADISQETSKLPVITIGCDTYSPFSYLDVDGNITGIDVELADEAFGRMGYQPEFQIINWEEKKDLVDTGAIDCIWSSFTMDGCETEYNWAGPYMQSHQVVAVNPDSDIHTLSDLKDKIIAVQSTTKPEDIIRSHNGILPELKKVISVQKRDLIFILTSKGYVDALAAHDTSVEQFMSESGLNFRILDEPLLTVGLGVAFSVNDTRGIDKELSETLDEMRKDGTIRRIIEKYLSDPDRYLNDKGDNYEK